MSESFGAFDVWIPFSADLGKPKCSLSFLEMLISVAWEEISEEKKVHDKSS